MNKFDENFAWQHALNWAKKQSNNLLLCTFYADWYWDNFISTSADISELPEHRWEVLNHLEKTSFTEAEQASKL